MPFLSVCLSVSSLHMGLCVCAKLFLFSDSVCLSVTPTSTIKPTVTTTPTPSIRPMPLQTTTAPTAHVSPTQVTIFSTETTPAAPAYNPSSGYRVCEEHLVAGDC